MISKYEIRSRGWYVWIGCHAEFISASHQILNQVQDDIFGRLFDDLGFVSSFDIRDSDLVFNRG